MNWAYALALTTWAALAPLAAGETVAGRVVDAAGQPVAGVSVKLDQAATTTDAAGRFQINAPSAAAPSTRPVSYADLANTKAPIVRFSRDGYQEQAAVARSSALADLRLPGQFPGKPTEVFRGKWERWQVSLPEGRDGFQVLLPQNGKTLPGRPWVLHCHFFFMPSVNASFSTDTLDRGFSYVHVGSWLGTPENVEKLRKVYDLLVKDYGFHPRPIVVGLSKGGHIATAWAIANPDKVSALYLDCPVLTVSDKDSWPLGPGGGEKKYWNEVVRYCGSTEAALAWKGNPVDHLEPLAKFKVPIISVYGGKDPKVTPARNILLAAERLKALGHPVKLLPKPNAEHSHGVGGADYQTLMQFLLENTATPAMSVPQAGFPGPAAWRGGHSLAAPRALSPRSDTRL